MRLCGTQGYSRSLGNFQKSCLPAGQSSKVSLGGREETLGIRVSVRPSGMREQEAAAPALLSVERHRVGIPVFSSIPIPAGTSQQK